MPLADRLSDGKLFMAKRILMVGPSINAMGGVATVERNILEAASMTRYDISFVATSADCSRLDKILLFLHALRKVKHYLGSCDICHVHMALGMSYRRKYIVCRAAMKAGVPYVLHVHEGDFENRYEKLVSPEQNRIRLMLERAAKVIVLSEEWKSYFVDKFGLENLVVLENSVFVPERVGNSKDSTKFFYLGRMCARKGVDVLLDATQILLTSHSEARVYFAGDGEKIDFYKAMAKDLGIENNVVFLGWADESMKKQLADKCLASVLPSNAEGLPMSVLEAMAEGCVAIATRVGGLPDLIENGQNGFLVDPGDSKGLARTMLQCIEYPDVALQIARNGRKTITEHYSMNKYIEKLEDLYEMLVEDNEA